jgi:hypothetical protein
MEPGTWGWPKTVTVCVLAVVALLCMAGAEGWMPWQ